MTEEKKSISEEERAPLPEIYKRIYSSAVFSRFLGYLGHALVVFTVFAFGIGIYRAFSISQDACVRFLLAAAIPFAAVRVIRAVLDFPRPYEVYDFSGLPGGAPKSKRGRSFPSRHVLSAFLIGVLLLQYAPLLAVAVLAAGCVISVCRFLLGIHFLKDVIVGALIGIVSGILGILFL